MSTQVHAPPTDEEVDMFPMPPEPPTLTTWGEDGGWCSACRGTDRRVAHIGTERCNVAICSYCLARLADAMRAPPTGVADR